MKKIIVLLSIMVFLFASLSHAYSWEGMVPVPWKIVVFENTTGEYVGYDVPVTTIRPNKSILGYTILPLDGNSETVVALYDGPGGASIVSDEMFDEAEADGLQSLPTWFEYPRKILTSLHVRVGPNTRAIVYWE